MPSLCRMAALCAGFLPLLQAQSEPSKLSAALADNHQSLHLESGQLSGPGAATLAQALATAQFVLVGEDHGIAQIPQFNIAVLKILAAHGLERLVVETGPLTAAKLSAIASQPDPLPPLRDFLKAYPDSVPFYNWESEFELLHQARLSNIKIVGIDQEFIGSPPLLLTELQKQDLSPEAQAAVAALLKKDAAGYAEAAKTQDFSKLTLLSATDEDFRKLQALVTGKARQLVDSWQLSWQIYHENQTGQGYVSNRRRARLMKALYVEQAGPTAKALIKIGAYHAYRGMNPLHSAEIGNLLSEVAEAHGQQSVHILIAAIGGNQAKFTGIGKPAASGPVDPKEDPLASLAPLMELMKGDDLSLFDMRPLRPKWSSLKANSPELERAVFGFDFIVLIPKAMPAKDVN